MTAVIERSISCTLSPKTKFEFCPLGRIFTRQFLIDRGAVSKALDICLLINTGTVVLLLFYIFCLTAVMSRGSDAKIIWHPSEVNSVKEYNIHLKVRTHKFNTKFCRYSLTVAAAIG